MSSEELRVEKRETRGKHHAKRMRAAGQIPAVLYGHGQETVALAVPTEDLEAALRHRAHLVQLKGAVSDSALLKEVQWDAFGSRVLHLDLTRVDANEAVAVTLEVQLRGDAPGTHHGGVIEQSLRQIDIECPANRIPEGLTVSINALEVGDSITVREVEIPDGATLVTSADEIVVSCVEPVVTEEAEEAAATADVEPEVIGRKPEEEEGSES